MTDDTVKKVAEAMNALVTKRGGFVDWEDLARAAISEMQGWRPISTKPTVPMTVIFYSKNITWWSTTPENRTAPGEPLDANAPYRDERLSLGFWDGIEFCWQGTGHAVWEWEYDEGNPDLPTHWMPAPLPPEEE